MKILMRSGKSPFQAISYEDVLHDNVLGTNSGNLIFFEAAWRLLSVKGCSIDSAGYVLTAKDAPCINNQYDHLVLPFANAFRVSFQEKLDQYSELIESINIPVTVLGVGAQTDTSYSGTNLAAIEGSVRRFVRAVLKKSPAIGVRGEYTYDYLRGLGFSDADVKIIGCPSLFYYGFSVPAIRRVDHLTRDSVVSMNVSPYVKGIADIFDYNFSHYKNLFYVPQNNDSLDQLLWNGEGLVKGSKVFPSRIDHPVFDENRLKFFIDPKTWINSLRKCDFVFGTRIHGNIAALLAGVPSFVLAHDSRTLELAKYFEIPHIKYSEVKPNTLAESFFARADYSGFEANHSHRFEAFSEFLKSAGLRHVYLEGEDKGFSFDESMSQVQFPEVMPCPKNQSVQHLVSMMAWLHKRLSGTNLSLAKELSKTKKELVALKAAKKPL